MWYNKFMVLLYSEKLPLGWLAPDFSLPATDGRTYSLSSWQDKQGLLIVFTCNHCPYAKAAWPLLIDLYHQFGRDIAFAAINPNDAESYPEDSFSAMQEKAAEWQIPFPYLRDESQEVARAYQAQCTPDVYLFKNDQGQFKLFYHGRINDNWQNPAKVKEKNLEQALLRLVQGGEPPVEQPPSMGCSIKWK